MDKLIKLAKKGNIKAIELVMDRWGGKVAQPIELPGVVFQIIPREQREAQETLEGLGKIRAIAG